jgi:hypothetical protein
MDGALAGAAAAPTGLTAWVMTNGQIVFFFAQIAYWFFIVVFLGYAVAQFKRWVNYQLGTGHSGQLRVPSKDEQIDAETEVSIEEFVE